MDVTKGGAPAEGINKINQGWIRYPNGVIAPHSGIEELPYLESGKVYKLNELHNGSYWLNGLTEEPKLILPKQLIWSDVQKRALKSVEKAIAEDKDWNELGMFFHGVKGSGKSVMTSYIAELAKAPIIKIHPNLTLEMAGKVLNQTKNEVMVIVLEESSQFNLKGDKNIRFFDQDESSYRKILILNSNTEDGMDDRLRNRSRIYYDILFEKIDNELAIKNLVAPYNIKREDVVINFVKDYFVEATTDVITMLMKEIKLSGMDNDITLERNDLVGMIEYLNIKTKDNAQKYMPKAEKLVKQTSLEEIYGKIRLKKPNLTQEKFMQLAEIWVRGLEDKQSFDYGKKRAKETINRLGNISW